MFNLKLASALLIVLLVPVAGVASTVVVPNAETNSPGNSQGGPPSSPDAAIQQNLFGSDQFSGPMEITGFLGRAAPGTGPLDETFGTVSIYLSTSSESPNGTGAAMMSTTFANNIGPDNTLVFSGTNVTLSAAGCSGPGVCPFGLGITFTTPFYYNPADGSLLEEIVVTGFVGSGFSDAETFSGPNDAVARVQEAGSATATTGTLIYGAAIEEFTFTPVPEPASWTTMAAGAAVLLWLGWRRRSGKRAPTAGN